MNQTFEWTPPALEDLSPEPPPGWVDQHFGGNGAAVRPLPDIEDGTVLLAAQLTKPPEIVRGLLHKGTKLVIGGASKSYKTWTLLDLALSVATGEHWWGLPTIRGPVCYLNFEIPREFFQERMKKILDAKGIKLEPGYFQHWPLRGRAVDVESITAELIERLSGLKLALIILDPTYKLLGRRDENSAGDVATMLNAFERIVVETTATIGFGAHYSKGNQAGKENIDRMSGSGVFARDPDSILTLTRHEVDNAFTVEPILRNLPPMAPFVVQWKWPLMRRNGELNPQQLKQAKGGRHHVYDPKKLLAAISDRLAGNPISSSEWALLAGIPRQTLCDYLPKLRAQGWISTAGEGTSARKFITEKGLLELNEK